MATTTLVRGFVRNGLIVPNEPVPEGSGVEIRLLSPEEDEAEYLRILDEIVEETRDCREASKRSIANFERNYLGEENEAG